MVGKRWKQVLIVMKVHMNTLITEKYDASSEITLGKNNFPYFIRKSSYWV